MIMKRENLKPKDEEELIQILSEDILGRYDDSEYWDVEIIENYLQEKEEEYKLEKRTPKEKPELTKEQKEGIWLQSLEDDYGIDASDMSKDELKDIASLLNAILACKTEKDL